MKLQFRLGTQFIRRNSKRNDIETVVDILVTRNTKDEVVAVRYVCEHDFMGQIVTDSDVPASTIARGYIEQ